MPIRVRWRVTWTVTAFDRCGNWRQEPSRSIRKTVTRMQIVERSPDSYVLRGGQAGAERLRLLNRVKWPTTEQLLNKAGLRAGMRVLDFGCGGGEGTLRMAALVRTAGEVVGTALDPSILRLAQQEAAGSNLPVTF